MSRKDQPILAVETPFYFPLSNGLYEIKPGLFKFPHPFGNQVEDEKVFQFDSLFSSYRQEKIRARGELLEKYYCCSDFTDLISKTINQFIVFTLVEQAPQFFRLDRQKGEYQLHCSLTNETLHLDREFSLLETVSDNTITPAYRDAFDSLACQLQEDLSVLALNGHGDDYLAALHLCFPNHWAARDKIGNHFAAVHHPVPNIEEINRSAQQISQAMIHKSPFVRFAWGLATDSYLNHHPDAPGGIEPRTWRGRHFNPARPELYIRVERQTIHGFPAAACALFTIRTYFYDVHTIAKDPGRRTQLMSAINSMSEDSLDYKGLNDDKHAILAWLKGYDR